MAVNKAPSGTFTAKVYAGGRKWVRLGTFATLAEAEAAHLDAKRAIARGETVEPPKGLAGLSEAEFYRAKFDYNSESGVLTHKGTRLVTLRGKPAGSLTNNGYLVTNVRNTPQLVHRIIWMILHGRWPEQIDHINGNRSDNRLENLRECNNSQNQRNTRMRKDNRQGAKGVVRSDGVRRKQYSAAITINGKMTRIGNFETVEAAHAAYAEAAKQHFGEFARAN